MSYLAGHFETSRYPQEAHIMLNRSYLESAIFETCKIATFIFMSSESTK